MKKFLALYVGSPPAGGAAPVQPSEEAIAKGMAAWTAWMEQHASAILDTGGPLGKTKKTSAQGVSDVRNNVAGYVVVQAESQEAAARMFEGHPHFAIFPGEGVEIMECLPVPSR